jgi:formiminoglutamase
MQWLRPVAECDLRAMTAGRAGETRLGEVLQAADGEGRVPRGTRVAIVGIPEDVGVRANLGRPGARRMWREALRALVHLQANATLDASRIAVVGAVDVRDIQRKAKAEDGTLAEARRQASSDGRRALRAAEGAAASLARLRALCAEIDGRVASVVAALRDDGAVPIVVGGGHNNALGILAGCAKAAGRAMGCVNVDLHADLRAMEGRHSGNPFSYALHRGALDRYAVVGLQECTANATVLDAFRDPRLRAFTLDAMVRGEIDLASSIDAAVTHVGASPATIEIDIDCVSGAPASATAASGLSPREVRMCAARLSRELDVHAAHIAEGAPELGAWPDGMLAKLVAELICDLAKGICSRRAP